MALGEAFLEILGTPSILSIVIGMMQLLGPIWIVFLSGIIVGWAWKPRWASLIKCKFRLASPSSSSRVVHHPVIKGYGSTRSLDSFKGVPCVSVPRNDKPRRVDVYYSSWLIQAVESRKRNGLLSACEVILFHHEEMGIPWEIAKFGVKQGMWGAVNTIAGGFRAYQNHRASGSPLSHHAVVARVNTNIDPDYLKILEGDEDASETQLVTSADEKPKGVSSIPKLLILGGAITLACSLDQGLLTKSLIFGVARKFGNMGRKAMPRTN